MLMWTTFLSVFLRYIPRYNSFCSNLTTLDGREIMWMNKVRYLGVGCSRQKR